MSNKTMPIRPSEIPETKVKIFPDEVFESFNELIAQQWCGHSVNIKQKDVIDLMIKKGLKKEEISNQGWLNIEEVYRSVGWTVKYDKPGYNENYEPSFTFSLK